MSAAIQKDQQTALQMLKVLYPQLANIPDVELLKAVAVAKRMGLDILEEVHFVPFGGRVQIVVAYTTYIKRAQKFGLLEWWRVDVGEDNYGTYAETIIKRRDWPEVFRWRVYLNEAKRDTKLWKEMPLTMLRKTTIAQAFRLCFPEVLDLVEEIEVQEEQTKEQQVGQDHEEQNSLISERQRRYLWAFAKEKGLTEEDVRSIIRNFGYEHTKDVRKEDFDAILKYIELYSQQEEAQ